MNGSAGMARYARLAVPGWRIPASSAQTLAGFNATYGWMISAAAAMGGLLYGYDWMVTSGTLSSAASASPRRGTGR